MNSSILHPDSRPFVLLGSMCVIGGGLVAAVTAPVASYHSSWAVAYIVLVAGVAQIALGLGQAALADGALQRPLRWSEFVGWNLGNAAVVIGTLVPVAPLLYVGTALLVATLVLVLIAIKSGTRGWTLTVTRAIIVLLLVSMPVGIALQALEN